MKSSTNRGGHCANPLFSAFIRALLPVMLLLVGNVAVKAQTESSDFMFNDNVRYSQWVINSRLNSFYANTTEVGLAVYDEAGALVDERKNGGKTTVDYVPGLVAKGVIEAAQYYSAYPWAKPWFLSVAEYGNNFFNKVEDGGGSLDNLNGIKLYITLSELTKTGGAFADNTVYTNAKTAIGRAITGLAAHNDNNSIKTGTLAGDAVVGGWFHKYNSTGKYNNQMWLDGQYMGTALLAQISKFNGKRTNISTSTDDFEIVYNQLKIVWDKCWNPTDKLMYHAFDANAGKESESHSETWAGLSSDEPYVFHSETYWARACGWYFLALVDVLEAMESVKDNAAYSAKYNEIKGWMTSLAEGLKARQDTEKTGGWYQILDENDSYSASTYNDGKSHTQTYNYIESSATAIFAAAYLKALNLGYLDEINYGETAKDAYKCIVNHFFASDGNGGVNIFGSCRSAGLGGYSSNSTTNTEYEVGNDRCRDGSKAYYLLGYDVARVAKSENVTEGKVLGAFILAATEYEKRYMKDKTVFLTKDLASSYTLGAGKSLTVGASGTGSVTYQWYKDGSIVEGATDASYVPAESGSYYCIISPAARAAGTIQSSTAEVTVAEGGTGTMLENLVSTAGVNGNKWTGTMTNGDIYATYTSDFSLSSGNISLDKKTSITLTIPTGYTVTSLKIKGASTGDSNKSPLTIGGDTYEYSGTTLTEHEFTIASGAGPITITMTAGNDRATRIAAIEVYGTKNGSTEPTTYTVTYNMNGHGDAINAETGVTALPTTLPIPTATGYTFERWYTDEALTKKATDGDAIEANTTLYAKWIQNSSGGSTEVELTALEAKKNTTWTKDNFSVKFDGTGQSEYVKLANAKTISFTIPDGCNVESITITYGTKNDTYGNETATITPPSTSSSTDFTVSATDGIVVTNNSGNARYISKVVIKYTSGPTYKVTYNLNGHGTLTETEKSGLTKLPDPLPTPTEAGWTFGGWYTDNNTFENVATPGATISEDTQLYAKWTRNTYKVTTSATNGTITVSATDSEGNAADNLDLSKVEHGTKLVFTANAQDGYVFSSWAVTGTSGTANGNEYTIESLNADTEVKANFKSTSAPTDGEICHFTGNTPSQTWTTVSGNYKTLSTGVTYKGVTYSDVVKMESSTTITVNSSGTQTAIFVFDAAGKKVEIGGVEYTTDKDGLVTLDLTAGTHTLKKGDTGINLAAIELLSSIAPEQDSRATFTYNNAELPFYEIKEGDNTVHVAEIVLMKSAGVTECEVSFETAEGAKLRKQGETDPLTSPIKVTAPTVVGEQSSYYTVTSKDGSSTTTYKITIKVIDQKRKIVLKYEPATFEWEAATQGKVTTDAFKTAWNANKPVLKAYLADENGNATTTEITPLPVGITYTPDIAGIVNIDASGNLNVIPGADGGVFVYAKLSNSAEYEESNEVSCNVIITQGYGTVKLKKGEAAPKVNGVKYITANGENLVKITFGGWKYGKLGSDGKYDHSYVKPGDTKTVTDEWNAAKGDDKGELASIDGHKYGWPGANDAANEDKYTSDGTIFGAVRCGWFKSPELDADGKVTKTYPFTLPVRGTYATFEPQMNGTLTVYIIQNGAWNIWDESGTYNKDNVEYTYKKFDIKKGEFRPHSFHVVNQRGLTLDQFATSWSVNTKQAVTSDYYCDPIDKSNSRNGILSPNVADWPEFNDGRLTEKEKQDIVDAWKGGIHGAQKIVQLHDHSFLAIQKGVVKYTFHVTGHETYYFFSNFSKMGFCGARFVPDEAIDDNGKPMQPVADLVLSDTEAFPTVTREPVEGEFYDENEQMPKYIYKYDGEETINGNTINIEGGVQAPQFKTITMNRTFKKGQWTTLSLPFNMTQSKVEEIFGVGTQLLLLDKATITNGTVKLHFLYHEIQNVLPGYPYLIKPTLTYKKGGLYENASYTDGEAYKTENGVRTITDGNLTQFVVPVKHINPDIKQQEIDCGDYVAKCVAENYSTGELPNSGNGQKGYSVNYKEGDIFISEGDGNLYISKGTAYGKGYRSYIEKKQGTQSVKSISMAFSGVDDGEHNTPTEIKFVELAPEAVKALGFSGVYNLNGQYVGDTTENLPAGVYIANGRKVVIK